MTQARILYVHGLESGPQGRKANHLRKGFSEVHVPAMHTGTDQLDKRNSFARVALRLAPTTPPWRLKARAIEEALEACVVIQRDAIAEARPDLVVGSSFGGAVLELLLARGHWEGPSLLLCPALRMARTRAGDGAGSWSGIDVDDVEARIGALPSEVRERVLVVHGDADSVVPLQDSRALCTAAGLELEVIPGGSHALASLTETGRLRALVEQLLQR